MSGATVRPRRRAVGWPLAILLIGLLLRLAYVIEFARHPLGRLPWGDEGAYWTRAQAIRAGHGLPDGPFYQDPLFPYLLAGLMRVVGPDIARLRIALACLGALTPLALYWAGRKGWGRTEGIAAGLLAAVCGPWIFTDGLIEKEGTAALGAALALGLTARAAADDGRAGQAGRAGFAWGLVSLLRANALVLAPLGAIWWWARGRGRAEGNRPRGRAGLYLLGFALAIAPVTLTNAVVSRPTELILTTWQAGANFYIGNGPKATGTYAAPAFVEANPLYEAGDFAAEATRRAGRPLTPSEVSRFWFQAGLTRWHDAPWASLRLLGQKVRWLFNDFEIPDNQDFAVVRLVASPPLAWGAISFGILLPLAALGVVPAARTAFGGFVVLSTAAGLGSTALFFIVGRYRVPWLPGLTLLAAAGLLDLARLAARRRWRASVWRLGLLAAPAAVVAWWPPGDPAPRRWGHAEIALALAYLGENRLDAAIDALDDARALGPGPAGRVAELLSGGIVHDRMRALSESRRRLAARAGITADLDLARWYRQLPEGRAESRRLLSHQIETAPDHRASRREWAAWWLGATDDPSCRARAAEELTRAARGPSPDASAAVLRALLTADSSLLPPRHFFPSESGRTRLRLARAVLAGPRHDRFGDTERGRERALRGVE